MHKHSLQQVTTAKSVSLCHYSSLFPSILLFLLLLISFFPLSSYAKTLEERYKSFFTPYYLTDLSLTHPEKVIASSNGKALITTGDTIYVSRSGKTPIAPQYYIFNEVDKLSEDEHDQDYIFKEVGKARYQKTYKNTLILKVNSITQEINLNDLVISSKAVDSTLPEKEIISSKRISGKTIYLQGEGDFVGRYQSVLLNIGQVNELKLGMRVYFFTKEQNINGYSIEPRYLGQGFIYRLASHHAIALITRANQEIQLDSIASTMRSFSHA